MYSNWYVYLHAVHHFCFDYHKNRNQIDHRLWYFVKMLVLILKDLRCIVNYSRKFAFYTFEPSWRIARSYLYGPLIWILRRKILTCNTCIFLYLWITPIEKQIFGMAKWFRHRSFVYLYVYCLGSQSPGYLTCNH